MCGPCNPPPRGKPGETQFGLTVGDRVKVTENDCFLGWHGHVRGFDRNRVAVDLDEPPSGFGANGNFFLPENLEKEPYSVVIEDEKGGFGMQLLLQHPPYEGRVLALKTAGMVSGASYNGRYEIIKACAPRVSLRAAGFHWAIKLSKIRDLRPDDRPMLVGRYSWPSFSLCETPPWHMQAPAFPF